MTGPVTVRNAVDTWTDAARPTKVIKQTSRLNLQTGSGVTKYGWLFFTLPFPRGAVITNATLRMYNAAAMTGSHTLSVRRAASKWSVNTIKDSTAPGVTGSTGTLTQTGAAANTQWAVDVTALMQEVSSGAAWYGFRLSTGSSSLEKWYATEDPSRDYRPVLIVSWSVGPEEPDTLRPSDGLAVAVTKPVLTYNFIDADGADDLMAHQVQIGVDEATTNAGVPGANLYDSGWVTTNLPQFDPTISAVNNNVPTNWPGLTDGGASWWWRVRAKDESGVVSPWSDAVEMKMVSQGALTITPTDYIWEGSPTFTLALAGHTLKSCRLEIYKTSSPNTLLWSSGKQTSGVINVPFGIIDDPTAQYIIKGYVWDEVNRVATVGQTVWTAVTQTLAVNFDNAVTPVSGLNFTSDPLFPIAVLTWTRAAGATQFQILRSEDGGTTWHYVDEIEESDANVGGTNYSWSDNNPPTYKTLKWRVVAVQGGHQSAVAEVSGQVRRLAPYLYRPKGVDAVRFLNPDRSMGWSDIHGLYEPMAGASMIVTQRLGKMRGSLAGRLVDDDSTGVTADEYLRRFKSMRANIGETLYVAIANQTFKINAYNFSWDVMTDTSGVTYVASFDWIEID